MIPGRRHRAIARMWLHHIPEPRRAEWLADLFDDLAEKQRAHGVLRADAWFVRETASLARAARRPRARRGVSGLAADVAAAATQLRRTPVFFVTAALMLAAGVTIAATTVGFIDAILLKPISRVRPDDVFRLGTTSPTSGDRSQFAFPEVVSLAEPLRGIADLTAAHLVPVVARVDGDSAQTLAEVVAGPYFDILALPPRAGRLLRVSDDDATATAVAVISDAWWASHYGRSPAAIGTTVFLNHTAFTVVGVAPQAGSAAFAASSTDFWLMASHAGTLMPPDFRSDRARRAFVVIGRLTANATIAAVVAASATASTTLQREAPRSRPDDRIVVLPGSPLGKAQRSVARVVAALLASLATVVLGVICANVGNLAMARGMTLRRATAIRLSLGASRGQVLRQALLEGAAISATAAACSAAAYLWIAGRFATIPILPTFTLRLELLTDPWFLFVVVVIAGGAGLVLALGPALAAARIDVIATLRDASGALRFGRRGARLRRGLVIAQVALSFFLMVMAAVFMRSLSSTRTLDLGIDVDRLAIMDFDVEPPVGKDEQHAIIVRALDAIRALPGAAAVAQSTEAPIDALVGSADLRTPGAAEAPPLARVSVIGATHGYFETVGVPILQGRGFEATDAAGSVAVINETLARRFGDAAGLDRIVDLGNGRRPRIVGVARNARYRSIGEGEQPNVYLVIEPGFHRTLIARAKGDPRLLLTDIQRTLDRIGPGVQGFFPRTGRDHLRFDLLPVEAGGAAAAIVGSLAVVLSGLGLYGLVAWIVELRRPELGLRLALGARPGDVRALVVRYAIASALPGVLIGLAATLLAVGAFRNLLFGVRAVDPVAFVSASVLVAALVLAAAWIPARRAGRIDSSALLRS
ncbi:MAG TPA: ABC transporter permease [Vicinamibacterales bacterium]|nr:ABC transporter permease [Vicinamibacterales bacterium]